MKKLLFFLVLPTLAMAQVPSSGGGSPPLQTSASEANAAPMRERVRDRMMEELPPELRKRFEDARQKVMKDPAIQVLKEKADAANGEFRDAVRAAMLKADPELAEIVKGLAGKRVGRPEGGGLGNLSDGDRQKLMAARAMAKDDPVVQAASAKRQSATNPEERAVADREFHGAMRAALLRADPALGPILDRIKLDGPRSSGGRDSVAPATPPAL